MICLISSDPTCDGSVPLTRASSAVSIVKPPVLAANCAAEMPPISCRVILTPLPLLLSSMPAAYICEPSWNDMLRIPVDGLAVPAPRSGLSLVPPAPLLLPARAELELAGYRNCGGVFHCPTGAWRFAELGMLPSFASPLLLLLLLPYAL